MNIDIKTVVSNLKAIVGEFPVKVREFQTVILPIQALLQHLEDGTWQVVETPTEKHPTNPQQ